MNPVWTDIQRKNCFRCPSSFNASHGSEQIVFFQESGSVYLQFSCSTGLQLEVIFEVLEEFDWTAFSVVTTRHHGYEDFLAMVEGMIDGSFIGWERKSVVMLNLTDDPGGARTRRLLKENEAQVSSGNLNTVYHTFIIYILYLQYKYSLLLHI